jgi:large subunit ribosomal protein L6
MSKIGKLPVEIKSGVEVSITPSEIVVKGPKGELSLNLPSIVEVSQNEGKIEVKVKDQSKQSFSVWGTVRKLISNMVIGVTDGFKKQLELVGTGYRAEVQGETLVLSVGYSHPVKIQAPKGVTFKVEKSVITVDGIDRQVVGQVAAKIREVRKPEPYKGKGIKYTDEVIRRKAGKAAKATVS